MKIMLVNKFHWLKGGSETYYFGLGKLLKENNHEVAYFSMHDERNINTGDKEYFVKKFDGNSKNIFKAADVIFSKNNYKKMKEAINDFKPKIVHVNNFQRQLSASIIKACNDENIPVVFTTHDLQVVCPAILMLDNKQNICEDCINGSYSSCIKKKCIKDSKLKSLLASLESKYYRNKKIFSNKINHIIAPSKFCKNKLVEGGISINKITSLSNFINLDEYTFENEVGSYGLYFGRLSKEKGINNLINAFSTLNKGMLYIAGTGPEEANVSKFINDNKLEDRIKLLGFLKKSDMKKYINNSRFVIVPSVCYENSPYSIIESIASGKPVLGSNIGGIPELIINGKTGYTYKYDDIDELSEKLKIMFTDDNLIKEFSDNSINFSKQFSKEIYYSNLMKIYNKVVQGE